VTLERQSTKEFNRCSWNACISLLAVIIGGVGLKCGIAFPWLGPVGWGLLVVAGAYEAYVAWGAYWSYDDLRKLITTFEKAVLVVERLTNACGSLLEFTLDIFDREKAVGDLQGIAEASLTDLSNLANELKALFTEQIPQLSTSSSGH